GPTYHCPLALTMTLLRVPPTPGSTTTTWIVPCGNSRVAVDTTHAPCAMSPRGMSCAMSTIVAVVLRAITPLIAPTYPSLVPKSVVSVMIAIAGSGKHTADEQGLP